MRIGVLASGSGTVLEAILAAGIEVSVVVVDRPCRATEVAAGAGVEAVMVERTTWGPDFDRLAHTEQLVDELARRSVDLVVMAGFMTILEKPIFDRFPGRVVNTHPSLLPAFPGAHAVADALTAGVKVTGCTVHLATPAVDSGPILAQQPVTVASTDDVDSLHERIKRVERVLYPATIAAFVEAGGVAAATHVTLEAD